MKIYLYQDNIPPCFPFHTENIIEGCGYSLKADFLGKNQHQLQSQSYINIRIEIATTKILIRK